MTKPIEWNPEVLINEVQDVIKKTLDDEAKWSIENIRRSFSQGGVSRPGQPPSIQSGRLSRALRAYVEDDTLVITVDPSEQAKAMALEFGAPRRNLRPRPFLTPQKELSQQRITRVLKKTLRRYGLAT